MKILQCASHSQEEIIRDSIPILKNGGLIIVPSDTVYGIAVDATNHGAVQKLIKLKSRPPGKAISIFCGSMELLLQQVEVSDSQEKTLQNILPGPFTVVLTSRHSVDQLLEAENGTLGVRLPEYDLINKLVTEFGNPLTATSANRAGQSPHYSIQALLNTLSDEKKSLIDLVIDAGNLPHNKPSTVIDMTKDSYDILREGDFATYIAMQQNAEELDSQSETETQSIAKNIIMKDYKRAAKRPLVYIFTGTLGAGKTVFIKEMALFLEIKDVVSPTFVIQYEYSTAKSPVHTFVHADLYRLKDADEFEHLGLHSYLIPGNLMCIEWGEKVGPFIKQISQVADCVQIDISYTGPSSRHFIIRRNF